MAGNVTFRDIVEVRKMIIWKEWMEEQQREWEELNRATAKAIAQRPKMVLETGSIEGTRKYEMDKAFLAGTTLGLLTKKLGISRATVKLRLKELKETGWNFYIMGDYHRIEGKKEENNG